MAFTTDDVLAKLAPLQVAAPLARSLKFSANEQVVAKYSQGLTRASQALAAVNAPGTRHVEYQHDEVRFFVATTSIAAESTDFILVLLGFGPSDSTREIVAALRIYPSDTVETETLLADPAVALATLLARYGAEYQIEGGRRSIFEPLVEFDRGRFVMAGRMEQAELLEALDLPQGIEDAYVMITSLRVMASGDVKLFFPILLRSNDYLDDVRIARGRSAPT